MLDSEPAALKVAFGPEVDGADWNLAALMDLDVPSPPADLQHAINHNQAACKGWLVEEVYRALGGQFQTVRLLGGWYGVLAAILLGDERFRIERVISYDIDPECSRVAESLNRRHCATGRFRAVTADVCAIDYSSGAGMTNGDSRLARASDGGHARDLVVNTSCEHIEVTSDWYDRVPPGTLLACQSNDYFDCPEHVNCRPDLQAFKADIPMEKVNYEGTLARKKYTRFMVIGRK